LVNLFELQNSYEVAEKDETLKIRCRLQTPHIWEHTKLEVTEDDMQTEYIKIYIYIVVQVKVKYCS